MSRPVSWLALVLGALGLAPVAVRGQDTILTPPNFERKDSDQYRQWLGSDAALPTKEQQEKTDALAKYLIRRLTNHQWQTQPGAMRTMISEATGWIDDIYNPKIKNTHLQKEFGLKMRDALEEVLTNPGQKNIALVNAGRILDHLISVGRVDEPAELIAKVLAEPKHNDGTRFWVFRSARHLLAAAQQKPPVV